MLPIKVFYHFFVPPDARAALWSYYVDQQLGLLKTSKLADIAEVYVAATMPMLWGSIFEISFGSHFDKNIKLNFAQKVVEYISLRYPFVKILEIRDIPANINEAATLRFLHDFSLREDFYALYFHSKGAVSGSPSVNCWREILDHYHVSEWAKSVKLLNDYQVLGVKDAKSNDKVTSGNYFWARSDYIRTLPEPVNTAAYVADPDLHPTGHAYRYGQEKWILYNNPKLHYLFDTKTDHYDHFCFLEDLLKKS